LFVCHTLYRNSDVFILCRLLSVSSQVMESFVAHMCLIHPLLEGCKMRVAMDLAQLELVLSLFCQGDVASLGHPYKMLWALRLVTTHKYCLLFPYHIAGNSRGTNFRWLPLFNFLQINFQGTSYYILSYYSRFLFLRIGQNPWKSWNFSPSKISSYIQYFCRRIHSSYYWYKMAECVLYAHSISDDCCS